MALKYYRRSRQRLFDHRFDIAIGSSNFDTAFAEAAGGIGNGTWFLTGGMLRRYAQIAFKSVSLKSFMLNHGMGGKTSRPLG